VSFGSPTEVTTTFSRSHLSSKLEAFEAEKVFAAVLEVVGKPRPGYAESEVDRAMCVRSPISFFTRAQSPSALRDSTLDRVGIVPGQSEADGHLCVQARPISLGSGGFAGQVGEVQAIRVSQRCDHWSSNWQTLAFEVRSVSRSRNVSLQLRVRDLEAVLHCELDT
jgi:hypothetical protein